MQTIRIELKMNGEDRVVWCTLGGNEDLKTIKFAIDAAFDVVESHYAKPEKATKKQIHKRHLFKKSCAYCGKPCRGAVGLSAHERFCVANPDRRTSKLKVKRSGHVFASLNKVMGETIN